MNIKKIIEGHALWLRSGGGKGSRANLSGADLSGVDLSRANLIGADLYEADLSRADLYGADLYGAKLYGANLSRADLSRADLSGANLSGADLYMANLSGANLYMANLSGADLSDARLRNTVGNGCEIKSMQCGTYQVAYTSEILQIGCERHLISDWWLFHDGKIFNMGGEKALKWWLIWKPILQKIIETAPAVKVNE